MCARGCLLRFFAELSYPNIETNRPWPSPDLLEASYLAASCFSSGTSGVTSSGVTGNLGEILPFPPSSGTHWWLFLPWLLPDLLKVPDILIPTLITSSISDSFKNTKKFSFQRAMRCYNCYWFRYLLHISCLTLYLIYI